MPQSSGPRPAPAVPTLAAPFALLDFEEEAGGSRTLLFRDPRRVVETDDVTGVASVLKEVERASRDGLHAVGFVSYEAAPAFDAALAVAGRAPLPLAWFGLFEAPEVLDASLPLEEDEIGDWSCDTTAGDHAAGVDAIRASIAAGSVYQVSYTVRLRAERGAGALSLYRRLRRAQRRAYGACIDIGRHCIVSASPELFFRRRGETITTRPMKGTARRGRWGEEDDACAAALAASEKERAENVMIVDLVRNDLGRIARPGSVRATRLFDVERYPTVLQMTSTVEATLEPHVDLAGIFGALFPCGSVTGAPKVAATRVIAALERGPRGIYCGAIGHVRPSGDATFSVAIRTAWLDRRSNVVEYGAGGGVTWDSTAGGEYAELVAKAAILTAEAPPFELVETMRLEDGVLRRRDRHLARLAASARYFDVPLHVAPLEHALDLLARSSNGRRLRVRVLVPPDGRARLESTPLDDTDALPAAEPLPFALAAIPVSSADRFLFHKTTHRTTHDRRRRAHPDAFDVLLWNERGELTEFTIGNLVVQLDGGLWTPPRDCGLLAGAFRAELLEQGALRERVLRAEDLARAQAIWLVNSVREWVPVRAAALTGATAPAP